MRICSISTSRLHRLRLRPSSHPSRLHRLQISPKSWCLCRGRVHAREVLHFTDRSGKIPTLLAPSLMLLAPQRSSVPRKSIWSCRSLTDRRSSWRRTRKLEDLPTRIGPRHVMPTGEGARKLGVPNSVRLSAQLSRSHIFVRGTTSGQLWILRSTNGGARSPRTLRWPSG